MATVHVYIGYDVRQPVAFQVAAHSVWKHATTPVSITRLSLNTLPITRVGLTQFTYSRFLVPYLSNYTGTSIFLDSDILVRGDLAELLAYPLMDPKTPVFCVQGPRRFEWPSVMVFNNDLCRMLTPTYIDDPHNTLFGFPWASHVGALPAEWNHLVGYDASNPQAKLVHFTQGIPVWPETKDCEFAKEWRTAYQQSSSTVDFHTLMGNSVHVPYVKAAQTHGYANPA